MSGITTQGGASAGRGNEGAGRAAPLSLVVAECDLLRLGLSGQVALTLPGEVLAFARLFEYADVAASLRGRPPGALVLALPCTLGGALAGLLFLRCFLTTLHAMHWSPRVQVVVVSDVSPAWIDATLTTLLPRLRDRIRMDVVATNCRLSTLQAALTGDLVVHERPELAPGQRLTLGEIRVLHTLLNGGVSVIDQARALGRDKKTLYTQRRAGMKRLGVSTLCGLLRWRGEVR